MRNMFKASVGTLALSLALGACASAPEPSPRLLAAEAMLQRAMANPSTAESGREPLEQAEASLRDARTFYMKREDDSYMHAVRMGEGYVALAKSRGDQLDANRKITSLNKDRADAVSTARTRQVAVAEAATASAEARAAQSQSVAAGAIADSAAADAARLAAERRAADLSAELAGYEQKKTDIGMTLILRDLQFESDSAVLSSGAKGRIAPLAAFLAKQPETRIQIAGHTDGQGAEDYNQDLSARRAASVGAYLTTTGVDPGRIRSVGMGETAPTATNDTAAGRAINRRVEVTILN